ncbi:MAG TPA: peptidase, partial [Planctomycetaceae bacterium]|nr:peptidase [Planctomycetaceae bacterium]
RDFEGAAKVKLLGLPANTSTKTPELEVTSEMTEIEFPVTIAEAAKPATYKSLTCQAILVQNSEPITYTQGGGELRVDKPLPPKVAAKPAPKAAAKPAAPVVAAAPPKRLTRLEQLRLDKKKAKEAAAGGGGE